MLWARWSPAFFFTISGSCVCTCVELSFLRSMKDEKERKGEGSSTAMGGTRNVWTDKQGLRTFVSRRFRLRINEIIFLLGFTGFQMPGELYFSGNELSDQGWLSDLLQILSYANVRNWSGTSPSAGFLPIWSENSNEENVLYLLR